MTRPIIWMWILLCVGVWTPLQSLAQEYPVITADNVTAIEQIGIMGGDQGRIAVSPDDHWLAIAGLQGVWIVDLDAGDESARLLEGHTDTVNTVVFHPDSQLLASGSDDGTIRFWNVETGEETQLIEAAPNPVIGLDFDESGTFLAAATRPFVRIFLMETGEEIQVLEDKEGGVRRVEFVNDSPLLFGATFDNSLAVWNLNENIYMGEIDNGFNGDVRGISVTQDGTQLAVGLFSGRVLLNTIETGEQIVLDYHADGVRDVQFSPNGRLVASTGMDDVVLIMDADSGDLLSRFELADFGYSLEFSSDSQLLHVASADGKVTTWDINREQLVEDRELAFPTVRQVVFSPNNRHIAAVTDEDNLARVFDVTTNQQIAVLAGHEGRTFSLSYRPTGNLIVTAGSGGDILVWRTDTFELADTLTTPEDRIYSIAFTPDPNVIATGGERFIRLWNLREKEEILAINHGTTVWGLAISPDGSLIAAPGGMWNAFSGERVTSLIDDFASVAFSPNSDVLATTDGFIQVEPNRIRRPRGGYVGLNNTRVAFSPDGTLVAMAVEENIEIIDVETQSIITTLTGHERDIRSLTFSPDGTRLVSGGYDATIRQWAVTGEPVDSPNEVSDDGIAISIMRDDYDLAPITNDSLTIDNIEQVETTILRQAIANVVDIDVSPDGSHAVVASLRGVFYLDLNNLTDAPIALTPTDPAIFSSGLAVDYATDGTMIAVSHGFARSEEAIGGGITIWDVSGNTPEMIAEYVISGDRGFSIALSNNNALVAVGFDTPVMRVLSVASGEQISESREPLFGRINGLSFIPDDSVITLSDTAGNKAFFETITGEILAGFNSGIAMPMWWSPDGSELYSAEQSGFNLRDGFSAEIIAEHTYPVEVGGEILTTDVSNGQLLVATENMVWFLDYETGEINEIITGFASVITTAEVTPDGQRLIGVTNDNHLRVWDIETGVELVDSELGFTDPIAPVAISDDGSYIAIAEREVGIRVFSGITGQLLREIATSETDRIDFLPASSFLVTGGQDNQMEFWDVATGDRIALIPTSDNIIRTISDNSDYLVTSTGLLTMNVHNTRNGNLLFEDLRAHITRTSAIDIDDNLMATGGDDGVVKLWDLQDREQEVLWYAHPTGVRRLAFAPTETLLATVGVDGVNVYDYRPFSNIDQRFVFSLRITDINGLYFSNDSELLFAHVGDVLHVWSMDNGSKVAEIDWLSGDSILTRNGEQIVAVTPAGSIYQLAVPSTEDDD